MSKPFFITTGQTIQQVAEETGIPHRTAQNIINRYKIPASAATPASILLAVHKTIKEYDLMGIKRNRRQQIMKKHGLRMRQPKEPADKKGGNGAVKIEPSEQLDFARAVRKVIRHPLFAFSFGIDCREELQDYYMKATDEIIGKE